MRHTTRIPGFLACLLGITTLALAMGGDHPPGMLHKTHGGWSDDLLELINSDGRVHGHWVNANDEFFYEGDTAAFNEFLKACAELTDTPLRATIHTGPERQSALWGEKPQLDYDWKLLVQRRPRPGPGDPARPDNNAGPVVTVDVWIDQLISLDDIDLPLDIELRSAGQDGVAAELIEAFIAEHDAQRRDRPDAPAEPEED